MRQWILICLLSVVPFTVNAADTAAKPTITGGAACVVAKKLGNSLAIEWSTGETTVSSAIDKAKRSLRARDFDYVFPQANSPLLHGWLVVVKSEYSTYTGKSRNSYGCGFSARSVEEAKELALRDLRTYSWGWKKKYGYQVIDQQQF